MRYWWVNQNQTYSQEVGGGYLWSPKRKKNGAINRFYENMRVVAPGDFVLSFQGTYIRAVGVATSHGYEAPKPTEFGPAGQQWSNIGWRVDVRYTKLLHPPKPADHMAVLRPLLPPIYAPLQANGHGNQGVYLTELPNPLAMALLTLTGPQGREVASTASGIAETVDLLDHASENMLAWENFILKDLEQNTSISATEREAIVMARRGQGLFKKKVQRFESRCRVTNVGRIEHLVASHIKPWRDCSSGSERLDGENGLLLTPTIDHLFDRGFISFEDSGRLLVSPVADDRSMRRMGVRSDEPVNVGGFSEGQRKYLDFHRDQIFLERCK